MARRCWPVLTILISRVSLIVWFYTVFKKCGKINNISCVLLGRILLIQHTKTSSIYSDTEKCFMLLYWFCQLEMVKKIVRKGHFILTFPLIPFSTRLSIPVIVERLFTVRGQSYVSRLPKYWPPTPLSACRVCLPPNKGGGYTLAGRRGGWGSIFWKTREIGLPSYSK